MYYVVRLANINQREKHHVFPISWMRNSNNQLEKFVKNRINRNQVHIFFWSNEKNDDGEPDASIQPNFDLPIQNTFPPTNNCCFLGQPLNFFCDYVVARAYMNGLRTLVPGLYNARRLGESPLPDLNQNTTAQSSDSEDEDPENPINESSNDQPNNNDTTVQPDSSNNLDEQQPINGDDSIASFDELAVSGSSDSMINHELSGTNDRNTSESRNDDVVSSSDSVPSNSNVCDETEKKPELHSLQRADVAEINAILNADDDVEDNAGEVNEASDDETDEQIEMVLVGGFFPRPVQYSCDNLLKREDDSISGNWAYNAIMVCIYTLTNTHVCTFHSFSFWYNLLCGTNYYFQENGNRIYKIGSKFIEVQKCVLDKIREWSIPPYDISIRLDRKIVGLLLVACVGVEKLAVNEIEDDVMKFIKSKSHTIKSG